MPAKAASLRITDAYRGRMVGIRNRAKVAAKRTWSAVRLADLDGTYNPGLLVLQVTTLQKQAAQLSAGYLSAYVASETGKPAPLPTAMALQAGWARSGSSLSKAFRSPLIGVKIAIGDGQDPAEALAVGGTRLVDAAGLATDEAAREALRIAMDHSPDVTGWQRALKGTCAACMGAADGATLAPGEVLDTHPNCQCVTEPVVESKTITKAEQDLLDSYVTGEGVKDSAALRRKAFEALKPAQQERIRTLQGAIDRLGEPAPGTVFRGVEWGALSDEAQALIKPGKTFIERGFSSTSKSREFVEGWAGQLNEPVIFEVDGAVGIDVEKHASEGLMRMYSRNPQREVLLKSGTKYKIKAITEKELTFTIGDHVRKFTAKVVKVGIVD